MVTKVNPFLFSGMTDALGVMHSPKAAPSTPAPVSAPAPAVAVAVPVPAAAAAATIPAPADTPAPATTAIPAVAASEPAVALNTTFDASTLATGAAYQAAVQNLIEMGFPAEQVARAMKAAYNNPDRAAEYLMTGIPDNVEAIAPATSRASAGVAATPAGSAAPAPAAAPSPTEGGYMNLFEAGAAAAAASRPGTGTGAPGAAAGGAPSVADLEAMNQLRNSAQFQQFRQLIAAQPQLLQPMLQQLGQSQPELLRVIQANPDAFLQMLVGGEGGDAMDFGDDDEEDNAGGALPLGTIQITPEENAAIERLTALGFDRNLAAQAYFACDKNEELAANYLFENGGDW
ncbi:XPC-binding domain-containing protein [Chytriomyces sp. MP71]|nr:XPC-binding domain-containing protein [Chytriomyces sp. MP71]